MKRLSSSKQKLNKSNTQDVLSAQWKKGYKLGDFNYFSTDTETQIEFIKLGEELRSQLPQDPYDKLGLRYRRFAKLVFDPISHNIMPIGKTLNKMGEEFYNFSQESFYNPEINTDNNGRLLPAIPDKLLYDRRLKKLIKKCRKEAIESGAISSTDLLVCNIHVVEQRAVGNRISNITPAVFHTDGEPFTAIILLHRDRKAFGGENFIGDRSVEVVGKKPKDVPSSKVLKKITLKNYYDHIFINDYKIAHHAEGIGSQDGTTATRVTLLIDFTPLIQILTPSVAQ